MARRKALKARRPGQNEAAGRASSLVEMRLIASLGVVTLKASESSIRMPKLSSQRITISTESSPIFSGRIVQISDPAPLVFNLQRQYHRGVHCIWFGQVFSGCARAYRNQ